MKIAAIIFINTVVSLSSFSALHHYRHYHLGGGGGREEWHLNKEVRSKSQAVTVLSDETQSADEAASLAFQADPLGQVFGRRPVGEGIVTRPFT